MTDVDDDETLAALRRDIDVVDARLVELLAERRAVVARIAAHKRARGLPRLDPAREARHRTALRELALRLDVPHQLVDAVLDTILADSRTTVQQQ